MPGFRKNKIEEQIKRIVGDTLLKDIKDPRIGFATVYEVKLSKDSTRAEIKISVLGSEKQKKDASFGLASARGYIRKKVGDGLGLRHVPEIVFVIDDSIEKEVALVSLIDSVQPKRSPVEETSDDESDGSDENAEMSSDEETE